MVDYKDNFPLNARVDINYNTKKVRFSYPVKPTFARIFKFVYAPMKILSLYLSLLMTTIIAVMLIKRHFPDVNNIFRQRLIFAVAGYYFSVLWLIPIILTLIVIGLYKIFNGAFPKYNSAISGTPKKIVRVTKLNSKKFELPFFKNILLDYEAYGDFDDYLERIEIKEHEFNKLVNNREVPNEFVWRAIFHFTSIPKKGVLIIKYK